MTVAVESGATPKDIWRESQNLREVLEKASDPISLHTCISEEVQKQLADTPFVEKEEAREIGLCRRVHLGLQILWKSSTVPYRESKRAAIWGYSMSSIHRIAE